MKTSLLLILALLSTYTLYPQEPSTHPDIPYTAFGNFDVLGDKIIALGTCDQIWTSTDHGNTWDIHTDIPGSLRDIALIPGEENRALLVGKKSYVFDFENGVLSENDLESTAWEVDIVGDKAYTYVSTTILSTDLEEIAWDTVYQDTADNDYVYITDVTDNYIYMGWRQGRLLRLNLTTEIVEHRNNFEGWVQGLSMKDDETGYLVSTAQADVIKLTEGGLIAEVAEGMPEAIRPLAYNDMVFTVNTNRIYRSLDGGVSSTRIPTANTREFSLTSRAMITKEGRMYLSGRGAMLAYSDDFGDTWTFLNAYNRSRLSSIDIHPNGSGYSIGDFRTILKTSDHGDTWQYIEVDPSFGSSYSDVLALDDNKALIATNAGIFTLENGQANNFVEGQTDHLHQLKDKSAILAFQFIDGVYQIVRSTDNGLSWQISTETERVNNTFRESSNGSIYLCTNDDFYYKSTDGGQSWSQEAIAFSSIRDLQFYNDNMGLLVTGRDLYKTTDGGSTFEAVANGYSVANLHIFDENTFIYSTGVNAGTQMRYTYDGGMSFKSLESYCVRTGDIHVNPDSKRIVFAHDYGHINVSSLPAPTNTNSVDIQNTLKTYPNPCPIGQNILVEGEWDELRFFDLNGSLIQTTNQVQKGISTDHLTPGIYILRSSRKDENRTQKVILL